MPTGCSHRRRKGHACPASTWTSASLAARKAVPGILAGERRLAAPEIREVRGSVRTIGTARAGPPRATAPPGHHARPGGACPSSSSRCSSSRRSASSCSGAWTTLKCRAGCRARWPPSRAGMESARQRTRPFARWPKTSPPCLAAPRCPSPAAGSTTTVPGFRSLITGTGNRVDLQTSGQHALSSSSSIDPRWGESIYWQTIRRERHALTPVLPPHRARSAPRQRAGRWSACPETLRSSSACSAAR